LQVEAREQTSGVSASVEVKPSYGLTDDDITGMLRASIDHARDDMNMRRLVEEKVEAQRVIEALNAALARDGDDLLSVDERAGVQQALDRLLAVTEASQDAREVESAIKQLEKYCEFYVERRMNSGIRKAMAGHRVDEFAQEDGREVE
jgi:molecular chaperone HscA